jgi:hypothetical protein
VRFNSLIQILAPIAFAVGFLAFGVVNFVRVGAAERSQEAKLSSIRAGTVQPETLTVIRKYVNAGRGGLPHVVFSSAREPKVNLSASRDFFNSVNLGNSVSGYYFPDGYFVPENIRVRSAAGRWAFLGFTLFLGGLTLVLAWAVLRRARLNP